jgi:hypothetical protein
VHLAVHCRDEFDCRLLRGECSNKIDSKQVYSYVTDWTKHCSSDLSSQHVNILSETNSVCSDFGLCACVRHERHRVDDKGGKTVVPCISLMGFC